MSSIVLPIEISFVDWAASLYIDLPHLEIPLIFNEHHWKEWARRLCELNRLSPNVPIPDTYNTWSEWAHYFLQNSSTNQ